MEAAQAYQKKAQPFARDALISANLDYANSLCANILSTLPDSIDTENLYQSAALGLVQAANTYKPSENVKFRSFAYLRIRGAIFDELRRNSPFPQKLVEKARQIRKVLYSHEPPVTPRFIADQTGLDEDEVTDVLATLDAFQLSSIEENEISRNEIAQNRYAPPEDSLETQEELQILTECIKDLPENYQQILHFFFREEEPLNQKEIAEVMGKSASQICRDIQRATILLKEYYASRTQTSKGSA